ncbi:type VII secretion-associated serine protease mycosin [Streptomyces sp. N50]|uniref:type VII secretion-associated serine protease mycosin n=1 Tax=Streptomyces sp. N50 TaxID=3081765 RepID=UPI0029622AF4|nr:type VII secretion-associated serine protease mycosin [Streptomyces sp. N50]WOX11438.1 type VII secretion-associated serine protease mycosin [Streptomyces sp. N50]
MRTRSKQARRRGPVVSAVAGVLLASVAVTPADADTIRSQQWYLDAMQAQQMWKTSTGKGVTVALIDSGVQADIPDLQGQIVAGKDFSKRAGDERTDYDGHGTSMAVIIAGTGGRGATNGSYGLAPGAKIMPIRVPDFVERNRTDGNQDDFATSTAKAIRFAADSDAKVINISLGSTAHSRQLTDSVNYALSKGKLIFAAVGNTGDALNEVEYPAAIPGVVGIGAIDRNVKTTKESQHGPQVDLVAPGADIVAACLESSTKVCETRGTSDATALASASAALIWSKHPGWTNNQVLRVMLNTASKPKSGKNRTDYLGYGAVRPRIALTDPGDPGLADRYPLPDLAAAGANSPSSGTSDAQGTGAPAKDDSSTAAASASKDDEGNSTLWIGLGIGAAVLLGGAIVAFVVARRRQSRFASPPVSTAPANQLSHPHSTFMPPTSASSTSGPSNQGERT